MSKFYKRKIIVPLALCLVSLFLLSSITPVNSTREGPEWFYDNFAAEDNVVIVHYTYQDTYL